MYLDWKKVNKSINQWPWSRKRSSLFAALKIERERKRHYQSHCKIKKPLVLPSSDTAAWSCTHYIIMCVSVKSFLIFRIHTTGCMSTTTEVFGSIGSAIGLLVVGDLTASALAPLLLPRTPRPEQYWTGKEQTIIYHSKMHILRSLISI